VIGDGCVVETGGHPVLRAVGARVGGKGARVFENIVGSDVQVGRGAFLAERAVISDYASSGRKPCQAEREGVAPQSGRGRGGPCVFLIWGEKWTRSLFGAYGIVGLANIEISPEFAAKVGAAYAARSEGRWSSPPAGTATRRRG